ncbi:MAG: hypothetical protein VCC67_03260 [Myxococcota bacterium]
MSEHEREAGRQRRDELREAGIDRLSMILDGLARFRECILYSPMRPEST